MLTPLSDRQLLELHCNILAELRNRNVVRSANNPVADYTEGLIAKALNLSLEVGSKAGYDACSTDGTRYQVKGRRLTKANNSTQLSAIRNLDRAPFDFLVPVIYDSQLVVQYSAIIPIAVVQRLGKYVAHTNATTFYFRRNVLDEPDVVDITDRVIEAAQ